jgi:hypothetical protein
MKPTQEQIEDAIYRCHKELQSLELSSDWGTHRNLVLVCTCDALEWVMGTYDERVLGIKSWEELDNI